ncbi:MAG TPA: hypothetical protein VGQ12_07770 [Candidatus Angelobacter sp.]|jgi:hypothetical protein|nr:hypothetical protein [Candidatus Angelobacter sp.]
MKKLAKRVEIEVMDRDNRRVIARRRVVPDRGMRFSPAGVDNILETFVEDFDQKNPGHKYRIAELMKNGCPVFKFVWDPAYHMAEQLQQLEAATASA